jgi:hypothetical protein
MADIAKKTAAAEKQLNLAADQPEQPKPEEVKPDLTQGTQGTDETPKPEQPKPDGTDAKNGTDGFGVPIGFPKLDANPAAVVSSPDPKIEALKRDLRQANKKIERLADGVRVLFEQFAALAYAAGHQEQANAARKALEKFLAD